MRDAYHEELDSIGEGLVEMARLVGSAIGRATTSMLDADLKLAETVIAADQKVDDLQHDLEARPSRCWPASSRWRPTCGSWSRRCG